MEQELALNPHLLQQLHSLTDNHLGEDVGAQLMKINSELPGRNTGSLLGEHPLAIAAEKAALIQQQLMSTNSFDGNSNSCDNSQDAVPQGQF